MVASATDIVGTAGVDIVPVAPLFHEKLKAIVLPGADSVGTQLGQIIGNAMAVQVAKALPKAIADGAKAAKGEAVKQGSSTGGAFADSLRAKLTAAFRAMPKLDIGLNDTGVDAQLARLRAKLEDLRNKRIGIDISAADADAKIQELDDKLAILGAQSPNVRVRVDTATARAALADLRAEIAEASRSGVDIAVRVGSFRERLVAQVEAAEAGLPAINITADTDPARRELDRYRAELDAIPIRLRTDANFNDAEALAKIDVLQAKLARLAASRASVDVRVDAARASAELETIRAEVDALDAKRATIHVNTSGASGAVMALALNIGALLAIPAIPILGAGVGGLAAAFTAGGAAAGAFGLAALPALKNVSAAMKAQTAAKNADTRATNSHSDSAKQAAQNALQMESAQAGLASAERSAAESIRSADAQVATSKRALAQAEQTAADQRKTALAGVKTAEEALAASQRTAEDAEKSLMQARKNAAQQIKDLDNQLTNSSNRSRETAIAVQKTHLALNAARLNRHNDPLGLQDAQLAYDEALQANKEQTQSNSALKKSAADQRKNGVDGASAVMSAVRALADANAAVVKQSQAVADAEANVGKVARQSAQAIQDAQRSEANAYRAAANARAQASESIASAERGIESARLSAMKGTTAEMTKAKTAADKYHEALAKLTPAGHDLFNALAGPHGLKSAFSDWSRALQPDVLPLFTRGVNSLKNTLPGLTPLARSGASGIGVLYDKASQQLKNPFWSGFKKDIKTAAEPAVIGLGVAFGNVLKGMTGIIDAFLPHMGGIAGTMDRITGRFAKWGSGLKGSPDFERFLAYVKQEGPIIAQLIGQILRAATEVAKGIQPIAQGVLGPVISAVAWLAVHAPEVIKLMYGIYLASKIIALGMPALAFGINLYWVAVSIATFATVGWAAAIQATGIVPLIELIVVVVAALAFGIYEAYKRVGWFRTAVDDSWRAIKVSTLFLWNDVLKPTFNAIVIAITAVGDASVWLWANVLSPTWTIIQVAAKILAAVILLVVVAPIVIGVKLLGWWFGWLWKGAIAPAFHGISIASSALWKYGLKPVFDFIGAAASGLYRYFIKPAFDLMIAAFHLLGDAASGVWHHVLSPIFVLIGSGARGLYDHTLKPTFQLMRDGISKVGDAFGLARDAIKIAWDQVSGIAKTPVKFVVDNVFNRGIRPVWNAVAKITGLSPLDPVDTSKWATGGVLPGYTPGRDPHEFYSPTGGRLALSGGEAIMRPEWTRAVGHGFVNMMNGIAASRGVSGVQSAMGSVAGARPGFFGGGILGGIENLVTDSTRTAINLGRDASGYLKNPLKIWDALTKKVTSAVASFKTPEWAHMVAQIPIKAVGSLRTKAVDGLKSILGANNNGGMIAGGGGDARWVSTIIQALGLVHQPANLVPIVSRRMMQESGGNPNAVNLWDSNAAAGHPSVGLMQLIKGTFQAYAGPFLNKGPFKYGVSLDPLAQFYSSMKYAMSRYGSLPAAYNRAGGYDDGGYLPSGDFGGVFNHSGKPEPVFSSSQWDVLKANIRGGEAPVYAPQNRFFIGDREITDIVRTEIDVHDAATASAINDGSRFL